MGVEGKLVDSSPSATKEEKQHKTCHPDWRSSELCQFEVEPCRSLVGGFHLVYNQESEFTIPGTVRGEPRR
eukprot:516618-Prorocentrum_lima.AAC.1